MRFGLAATFLSRVEFGGETGFVEAVEATEREAETVEAWRREEADMLRTIVEEVFEGAVVVRLISRKSAEDDRYPFESSEREARWAEWRASLARSEARWAEWRASAAAQDCREPT